MDREAREVELLFAPLPKDNVGVVKTSLLPAKIEKQMVPSSLEDSVGSGLKKRRKHEPNRSALDYESEGELRRALMSVEDGSSSGQTTTVDVKDGKITGDSSNLDWVLHTYDPETTEAQSMEEELHRLQTLKSYLVLDAEREEAFERITGMATRVFDVPIALVSLVDLGRQWFLSAAGIDATETPRKHAFCAHAILSKNPETPMVIPDARLDFRFRDNPLVTGPPHIRFYAGAPLISPENFRLGTFCVVDTKPRPNGLTLDEQETLKDMADMTVKIMVDRRYRMENRENPAQLIAYTAHDLMTPLTGVQLSLSLLKEDEELKKKLSAHQLELLSTAANCSDLMIRICETSMDGLREDRTARAPAREGSNDENVIPVTQTKDLVKSLHMIMEPIPKHTPLIITLDPAVPEAVVGDDLKLFRSALNLVSNACNRTLEGTVHMRIYTHQDNNNRQRQQLVFECEDTAPDIDVEEYQYLFQPSSSEDGNLRLGLSSVASLITSLDGEYGFRPRVGRRRSGSIFWFSIPLYVPDSPAAKAAMASIQQAAATAATVSSPHRSPHPSPLTIPVKLPNIPSVPSIGSLRQMGPGTAGLRRTGSTGSATGSINRTGSRDSGLFKSGSGNSIYQSRRNGSGSSSVFRRHGSNSNVLNVGVINESALNAVFDPSVLECIDPAGTSFNSCLPWSNILPRGSLSCGQEAAQVASAEDDRKMPAVERSDEEDAAAPKAPVVPEDAPAQEVFAEVHEAVAVPQVAVVGNEETSEADSKPSKPQPRKRRALVIDDSLVIRKSLCRALQKLGFEVVTAVDGLEGLKEMKKTLFDLVLCDFLMPVMDGLDCVKQYREWESQNRPRFKQLIIGISAHANVNDSGQGIKAGMDDFKAKPISIKTLEELQGTDIAVARTRQLDELEGSASRANVVDADDTKPADTKPSGEETGKRGMDNGETSLSQEAKRQKTVPAENQAIRVCLMATDTPTKQSNKVLGELESRGWKVAVVHNGNDALRVLKMRNWDVVLIDDDLPQLSGIACVTKFREWEAHNRVNGQKNLFMVCEGDIPSPSDKASVIQPPSGCNGVLRKPVPWKDLQYLIQEEIDGGHDCGMNIVVRKKKVGAAASSN